MRHQSDGQVSEFLLQVADLEVLESALDVLIVIERVHRLGEEFLQAMSFSGRKLQYSDLRLTCLVGPTLAHGRDPRNSCQEGD